MLIPFTDQDIKKCSKCKKKKLLKLFRVDDRHLDGLSSQCRPCQNESHRVNRKKRSKGKSFKQHLWEDDSCTRCQVERKRTASIYKVNYYNTQYKVNNEWVKAHPKCKAK